jgi:hypothetical protein
MTMITKTTIQLLRDDVNAALAAVASKHGLAIRAGNATYNENAVTFKLVCSTVSDGGRPMTPQATAYAQLAGVMNWAPLFSTIKVGIDEYTVVGYNARARKQPVIVERNGKQFKVAESLVARANGGAA